MTTDHYDRFDAAYDLSAEAHRHHEHCEVCGRCDGDREEGLVDGRCSDCWDGDRFAALDDHDLAARLGRERAA